MAVLTLPIDDNNISDSQYQQALKIVNQYTDAKEKANRKQKRIEAKAKELKEYQLKKFAEFTPIQPKDIRVVKLSKTRTPEEKAKTKEKKAKAKKQKAELKVKVNEDNLRRIKPELDKDGNITHFNLYLLFSPKFINFLIDYFIEHKKYEINPLRVAKTELMDINIFKFNKITNFKTYHVVTLVKFLNQNNLPCTHEVYGNNKIVAKVK